MTSRRIMTHVNPEKQVKKFYTLLNELKEIYFSNYQFSARFLEEEIRDAQIFAEGSETRRMATVKELFTTHFIFYWMAIKFSSTNDRGEQEKYKSIIRKVGGLLRNQIFRDQVLDMINHLLKRERVPEDEWYTAEFFEDLLVNISEDETRAQDIERLTKF